MDPIQGGWSLSVQRRGATGKLVSLMCSEREAVSLEVDGSAVRATIATRWSGSLRRFGQDGDLIFTLNAPDAGDALRLEWRGYSVRLYDGDRLADEDWVLGELNGGPWRLDRAQGVFADLRACPVFPGDPAQALDGTAQYYRPGGFNANAGDCMPFEFQGQYHLFYLFDRRHHGSKKGLGAHQWAHLSTNDMKSWTAHPVALGIDDQWEGSICTGSLIEKDGRVYAFYAVRMADGSPARLTWAESDDCVHFRKSGRFFELAAPYEPTSARDPKVWLGEDGRYHMMVTTSLADVRTRGGCLAHLVSDNLTDWEQLEPMLVPGYDDQPECSDYFKTGDRYYLVFSNHGAARYRVSQCPFGPWKRLSDDALDFPALCVPKTALFHGKRLTTGWVACGGWGGCLVTHELTLRPDGTLGTRFIESLVPDRAKETAVAPVSLGAGSGSEERLLAETGENFRARLTLSPLDGNMAYGLEVNCGSWRARIEFDTAFETVMLITGGKSIASAERREMLARAAWTKGRVPVDLIVCGGVMEIQLPEDHVMLTWRGEEAPCRLSVYARGRLRVE